MRNTNLIRLAVPLVLLLLISSCSKNDRFADDTSNKVFNQGDAPGGQNATQGPHGIQEIKVTGKGFYTEINEETVSFTIHALRKTNGEVSGNVSFTSSSLDFGGDVECVNLVEGKLVVTGVIKQLNKNTRSFAYIGIMYQLTFEDNGDGTGATADRMSGISVGAPFSCDAFNLATPNEIQGNITILQ